MIHKFEKPNEKSNVTDSKWGIKKLCPACINDFLSKNEVEYLKDELWELHGNDNPQFELCKKHSDLELKAELRMAREATRALYERISSIEVKPEYPSQVN